MSDLNIRKIDDELYWQLKQNALASRKSLREYCIALLMASPKAVGSEPIQKVNRREKRCKPEVEP